MGLPAPNPNKKKLDTITAEYLQDWLSAYLKIHRQIGLLETLESRHTKDMPPKVRRRIAAEAKFLSKRLRALLSEVNRLLHIFLGADASKIIKGLLQEHYLSMRYQQLDLDDARYMADSHEILSGLSDLGLKITAEQEQSITQSTDAKRERMIAAGETVDEDRLQREEMRERIKMLVNGPVVRDRRVKYILDLVQTGAISEAEFTIAAEFFEDPKFGGALLDAAVAETDFCLIFNRTAALKDDLIANERQSVQFITRQITQYADSFNRYCTEPTDAHRKEFTLSALHVCDTSLKVIDENLGREPSITAKAVVTPARLQFMANMLTADIAQHVNNPTRTFELNKKTNDFMIIENSVDGRNLDAGIVKVSRTKSGMQATLPPQWFADNQTLDPQQEELTRLLFAQMKGLPAGTTVKIGNCFKIPEVAIKLHKMATDAGLIVKYRNDGTHAAVRAFEAEQRGKPLSKARKVVNRFRG